MSTTISGCISNAYFMSGPCEISMDSFMLLFFQLAINDETSNDFDHILIVWPGAISLKSHMIVFVF